MSLAVNAKLFGLGMAERRASKCPCSAYEIPCCASKNSLLRCVGNLLVSNWSCLLIGVQKRAPTQNPGKFPANFPATGNFEGETGSLMTASTTTQSAPETVSAPPVESGGHFKDLPRL